MSPLLFKTHTKGHLIIKDGFRRKKKLLLFKAKNEIREESLGLWPWICAVIEGARVSNVIDVTFLMKPEKGDEYYYIYYL